VGDDPGLWAGAVERLQACGVESIGLIHRGISSSHSGRYRNDPAWNLAIAMRTRYPSLPFICDPSHIADDSALVGEIVSRSLALGIDGLMLEVHPAPAEALSDGAQQLNPSGFAALMASLKNHDAVLSGEDASVLETLRAAIDDCDARIIAALAERMEVSRKIGSFKREHSVPILQTSRWEELLSRVIADGTVQGLNEEFIRRIYSAIHEQSASVQ
ncbi:MAG: chorismate mutase, partial [Bacteroidales bacterium]|nr:chorismate mutase [Candidatus Cryptobacteroides aphodequi]